MVRGRGTRGVFFFCFAAFASGEREGLEGGLALPLGAGEGMFKERLKEFFSVSDIPCLAMYDLRALI